MLVHPPALFLGAFWVLVQVVLDGVGQERFNLVGGTSAFFAGREIIYVFGRYPANPSENSYVVYDLVLCHGSFLNADNSYVHKNKSVRGMGSFGDVLLRDRKMYVAPTPFGLLDGVERQMTSILPAPWPVSDSLIPVGELVRTETDRLMTGYYFDLTTNKLQATYTENPSAGQQHHFIAYRSSRHSHQPAVTLRQEEERYAKNR